MSALEQPSRERRRRPRRRWPAVVALLAGAVLLLLVGVALGFALHDDPEPGGSVTIVRTLEPGEQETVGSG